MFYPDFLSPLVTCSGPSYSDVKGVACNLNVVCLIYYAVVLTRSPSCQHLVNPHHPGGYWATLLNISPKHCFLRWIKLVYQLTVSIKRPLKRRKTYPPPCIDDYRRPGLFVGYDSVKRRLPSEVCIIQLSSTIRMFNTSIRPAF